MRPGILVMSGSSVVQRKTSAAPIGFLADQNRPTARTWEGASGQDVCADCVLRASARTSANPGCLKLDQR
jgi:hypothetical protein